MPLEWSSLEPSFGQRVSGAHFQSAPRGEHLSDPPRLHRRPRQRRQAPRPTSGLVPKELITTFPEDGETGAAQAELHDDLLSEMSDLLPIKEKTS